MELLEMLKNLMSDAESFKKSKNFYFEHHICDKTGENIKINLNLKLSTDDNDKIMKFGMCENCKTLFYYYDFENQSF